MKERKKEKKKRRRKKWGGGGGERGRGGGALARQLGHVTKSGQANGWLRTQRSNVLRTRDTSRVLRVSGRTSCTRRSAHVRGVSANIFDT